MIALPLRSLLSASDLPDPRRLTEAAAALHLLERGLWLSAGAELEDVPRLLQEDRGRQMLRAALFAARVPGWREAQAYRDAIVCAARGLAAKVVRRDFCWVRHVPFDDLLQEATFGVIRALELYDPGAGVAFSTYAAHWIRHHVSRAVARESSPVRQPGRLYDDCRAVSAARARLGGLGRDPSAAEVAAAASVPEARVHEADAVGAALSMDSGRARWPDLAASARLEAWERAEDLRRVVALARRMQRSRRLSRRVVEVFVARASGRSLDEVGAARGITGERVRQIEAEAVAAVRREIEREGRTR